MAPNDTRAVGTRLASIDVARFFAICLVFYGHLIEQVMYLGNTSAAIQYKWVYSFHMPLFYLLSGVVFSDRHLRASVGGFLKRRLTGRVLPYLFFSAVVAVLALVIRGWFPTLHPEQTAAYLTAEDYIAGSVSTLLGFPAFNIPLWFLASLVGIEIFHYAVGRFLTSPLRVGVAAIVFYLVGYYLNLYVNFFALGLVFWLVNLIPLGYAFYLVGLLLRRTGFLEREFATWQIAGFAVLCLAGVFLTYNLNTGPWRMGLDAVVMLAGAGGNVFWFPVTALIGSGLVIAVARLMPASRWLAYLGEITLVIYGLHGLFYHFVFPPLAGYLQAWLPTDAWALFTGAAVSVLVSVGLVIPFAVFIERRLPWVLGRSRKAAQTEPLPEAGV